MPGYHKLESDLILRVLEIISSDTFVLLQGKSTTREVR